MSELNNLGEQFIKENDEAKKNEILDRIKSDEFQSIPQVNL